jgi:hypothetical protein
VAPHAPLTVTFGEAVTADAGWFAIECANSGLHAAVPGGGPTIYTLTPALPFTAGEQCAVTIHAARLHDNDSDDPPDTPAADFTWRFTVAAAPVEAVLINEIDTDTPGSDAVEFIELYDGGRGGINLAGLVLVLWNGQNDTAYAAIDLTGVTDPGGYFTVGDNGLPGVDLPLPVALQNGPDAIALYAGRAANFPNGTPLTTAGLRDAVVYGPADASDTGLLTLLEAGQPQLDESTRGDAPAHALQRCPDGAGGPRRTSEYRAAPPTPGASNHCPLDAPPSALATSPAPEATDVPLSATLIITFSEPVDLSNGWIELSCGGAPQALTTLPGPTTATAVPAAPLPPGATCTATLRATAISDQDSDDPPDAPAADVVWQFYTAAVPPILVAGFTSNSPVWVDQPVIFTNTTTTTGPDTPSFVWDFGDGTTSTAQNPTHRYTLPGRYTVTLTATAGPTATARAEVIVRPRLVLVPFVGG